MADDPGGQGDGKLGPADAQTLLDGIDAACIQVLHGRFGGGIDVSVQRGGQSGLPQILRESRGPNQLSVILLAGAGAAPQANGHALTIGTLKVLPPPGGIDDITVSTEIFDERDANEASDGSYFGGGIRLAPRGHEHLPGAQAGGGLVIRRSTEADAAAGHHGVRAQRGWLARQTRQTPSRALGLSGNGHRRHPPSSIVLPVSADLLIRIGIVVAGLQAAAPPLSVGALTLLVQTGADEIA